MRGPTFNTAVFVFLFLIAQSVSATPKYYAVGVYDAGEQNNAVDKSALYDATLSTGAGKRRALIMDFDDFSPLIFSAFTNGQGGVVNFDNGVIEAGQRTDSFAALFSGKAVLFKSTDHIRSDYVSSSRTPISGPGKSPNGGFLAKSTVMGDICAIGGSYQLKLEEHRFEPGEHVRGVAGTILGKKGGRQHEKWTMKVTLDNGDMVAASAIINLSSGNKVDDTFFGACAPADRYITEVSWICKSGEFSGLDDLAFITSTSNFPMSAVEADENPAAQPSSAASQGSYGSSYHGETTLFGREKFSK